jgi:steroid delta-isomerase-like uncharacterized protein
MSIKQNKALVRRWVEEHNRRNHLAIDDEVIASDFLLNGHPLGLAGEKQYSIMTYAAFPDMRATIEDLFAEGDRVAARVRYEATHQGEWLHPVLGRTIPPTGKRTIFTGITIVRFADGKITEQWAARDSLGNLQQLGVLPGGQQASAPPQPGTPDHAQRETTPASAEENKTIVRRWYQVWNEQRLDGLDELYAATWVGHFPQRRELQGVAAHKPLGRTFQVAFPDMQYTVEDLVAEGDRLASRYVARGTHRGELAGIPPTGKAVAMVGLNIHRIAGGNIAEQWAEFDTLGVMQQVGALAAPANAP